MITTVTYTILDFVSVVCMPICIMKVKKHLTTLLWNKVEDLDHDACSLKLIWSDTFYIEWVLPAKTCLYLLTFLVDNPFLTGDISPVNAAEELVACLIMLMGVIAFGFIIAGSQ